MRAQGVWSPSVGRLQRWCRHPLPFSTPPPAGHSTCVWSASSSPPLPAHQGARTLGKQAATGSSPRVRDASPLPGFRTPHPLDL